MQASNYFQEATTYFQKSLSLRENIGNQHGAASSLRRLGVSHLRQWHLFKAIFYICSSFITYNHLGMLNRRRIFRILKAI